MIGTLKLLYQRSTALFRPPFEPSLGRVYLDSIRSLTKIWRGDKLRDQLGGGQPNSTQLMPMPILRFECGIGINWHKLAHFF